MKILDKLRKQTAKTISEYEMIKEGDRILVAISGGKDSSILLLLLNEIRKKAPFSFSLHPVLVDQALPDFDPSPIVKWVKAQGHDLTILKTKIFEAVREKMTPGSSPCGLCSRFRRGALYNYAFENNLNKIALGHHRDDLNETLLLSMFFSGEIRSMPPVLHSDDERNTVIRPISFLAEKDIIECANSLEIPIVSCDACGFWDGMKRARIRSLLSELENEFPDLNNKLLASQKNVRPSQLADQRLWY